MSSPQTITFFLDYSRSNILEARVASWIWTGTWILLEMITKIAIFAAFVPHQFFSCINHCNGWWHLWSHPNGTMKPPWWHLPLWLHLAWLRLWWRAPIMMASMAPLAPMAGAQLFLLVALPDLTRLHMTCTRGLSKFWLFRLQNVVLPFLGLCHVGLKNSSWSLLDL